MNREASKPNFYSERHQPMSDRVITSEPNCIILDNNTFFREEKEPSSPLRLVGEQKASYVMQ